jgi:hypothetical protein
MKREDPTVLLWTGRKAANAWQVTLSPALKLLCNVSTNPLTQAVALASSVSHPSGKSANEIFFLDTICYPLFSSFVTTGK